MRTQEERIIRMHERAKEIRRRRDREILSIYGGVCICLCLTLLGMLQRLCGLPVNRADGAFTGSSLLAESVGGYVLAAVIAFMVGVAITAVIIKYRNRVK